MEECHYQFISLLIDMEYLKNHAKIIKQKIHNKLFAVVIMLTLSLIYLFTNQKASQVCLDCTSPIPTNTTVNPGTCWAVQNYTNWHVS